MTQREMTNEYLAQTLCEIAKERTPIVSKAMREAAHRLRTFLGGAKTRDDLEGGAK